MCFALRRSVSLNWVQKISPSSGRTSYLPSEPASRSKIPLKKFIWKGLFELVINVCVCVFVSKRATGDGRGGQPNAADHPGHGEIMWHAVCAVWPWPRPLARLSQLDPEAGLPVHPKVGQPCTDIFFTIQCLCFQILCGCADKKATSLNKLAHAESNFTFTPGLIWDVVLKQGDVSPFFCSIHWDICEHSSHTVMQNKTTELRSPRRGGLGWIPFQCWSSLNHRLEPLQASYWDK